MCVIFMLLSPRKQRYVCLQIMHLCYNQMLETKMLLLLEDMLYYYKKLTIFNILISLTRYFVVKFMTLRRNC
jgi:hypothetical protein